jgi:hypothetical protein
MRYSELRTRAARAQQTFLFLREKARNRQIVTYKLVGDHMGYHGAGVLAQTLDVVQTWCEEDGHPPITALVVNKTTGAPGVGFRGGRHIDQIREEVFQYDWHDIVPPTIEELS